ncbi:hypothetical protein [Nonomuraea sp. NPDC049784]|uniref:hypothetical protein n=1 Tax=Nonomuraea sp. NPDC049784 TaxID=3154361 RepID=UPI0033E28F00
MADREVDAWTHRVDRTWGDGHAEEVAGPDRRQVDDDARQFDSGPTIKADRSHRPPPKAQLDVRPRRDIIWEPGSKDDLVALQHDGQAGSGDLAQAVMRVQSLVYDLHSSEGRLAGDPKKIGKWYEADFALVSLDELGQRRLSFEGELRSLINPSRNLLTVTAQLEQELDALPFKAACKALDTIEELAHLKAKDFDAWHKEGKHDWLRSTNPLLEHLYRAELDDKHHVLYTYTSSPWPEARVTNERKLKKTKAPVGRATVQVLAVLPADASHTDAKIVAAERTMPRVQGRILYRVVPARQSPTGRDAVQILAVKPQPLSEDFIIERVTALQERTLVHQLATNAKQPLAYSKALRSSPGAEIVRVGDRNDAVRANNGLAPRVAQRPRVRNAERTPQEDFERSIATALPQARKYELRFNAAAELEWNALPPGPLKRAVREELTSLAMSGQQSGDVHREPPAGTPPPSAASQRVAEEYDLTGLRPRYVSTAPDQQPTYQIIYDIVRSPLAPRANVVHAPVEGEDLVPVYDGRATTRLTYRPKLVEEQRQQAQQLNRAGVTQVLAAPVLSHSAWPARLRMETLASAIASLKSGTSALARGLATQERYEQMRRANATPVESATSRLASSEPIEDYRDTILVVGILPWPDPETQAKIAERIPGRAKAFRETLTGNRGLTATASPRRPPPDPHIMAKIAIFVPSPDGPIRQQAWLSAQRNDPDMIEVTVEGRPRPLTIPRDALAAGTERDVSVQGVRMAPKGKQLWFGLDLQPDGRPAAYFATSTQKVQQFLRRLPDPDRRGEGEAQRAERILERADNKLRQNQLVNQSLKLGEVRQKLSIFVYTSAGQPVRRTAWLFYERQAPDIARLSVPDQPGWDTPLPVPLTAIRAGLAGQVRVNGFTQGGLRIQPATSDSALAWSVQLPNGDSLWLNVNRSDITRFLGQADPARKSRADLAAEKVSRQQMATGRATAAQPLVRQQFQAQAVTGDLRETARGQLLWRADQPHVTYWYMEGWKFPLPIPHEYLMKGIRQATSAPGQDPVAEIAMAPSPNSPATALWTVRLRNGRQASYEIPQALLVNHINAVPSLPTLTADAARRTETPAAAKSHEGAPAKHPGSQQPPSQVREPMQMQTYEPGGRKPQRAELSWRADQPQVTYWRTEGWPSAVPIRHDGLLGGLDRPTRVPGPPGGPIAEVFMSPSDNPKIMLWSLRLKNGRQQWFEVDHANLINYINTVPALPNRPIPAAAQTADRESARQQAAATRSSTADRMSASPAQPARRAPASAPRPQQLAPTPGRSPG